jgi:hypothetical protein
LLLNPFNPAVKVQEKWRVNFCLSEPERICHDTSETKQFDSAESNRQGYKEDSGDDKG